MMSPREVATSAMNSPSVDCGSGPPLPVRRPDHVRHPSSGDNPTPMAKLRRPDGVELHIDERGEGPPVVFAPYWSGSPSVYEALLSELAGDHRIVSFDARGTGQSTHRGPYDMTTDCADLEAVLERAGGPAVVLSVADGCNRADKVAHARPDPA